jgi:hypothetical protein
MKKYILVGHEAVPADDLQAWARNFEKGTNRHVALTKLDGAEVSTVFLGLDHSFGDGPPLLFETMVFGGVCDQEQDRYSTWAEAEAGHAAMVEKVRHSLAAGFSDFARHSEVELQDEDPSGVCLPSEHGGEG